MHFKSTTLFCTLTLALGLVPVGSAEPVQADALDASRLVELESDVETNGVQLNGVQLNGVGLNGVHLQSLELGPAALTVVGGRLGGVSLSGLKVSESASSRRWRSTTRWSIYPVKSSWARGCSSSGPPHGRG